MAWRIEFDRRAEKELDKIDRQTARRILAFLLNRIARLDDPRAIGQALKGSRLGTLWKYRVGDYCIIADIQDDRLCVLVLKLGNRREVYR